jgi:hypothetical protein
MEISSKVKQALLFLKKNLAGREAKTLSLLRVLIPAAPNPTVNKSFLLLFFKKEALSSLALNLTVRLRDSLNANIRISATPPPNPHRPRPRR